MNTVTKSNKQSQAASADIENKIKKINRRDLGNIFKKLEPNAFSYDKNLREALLHTIDDGNQLGPEDYTFISDTYTSHINELLPEIDKEQDNNWIVSVTLVYVIAGIGLRILLNSYEQPVMLFMGAFNILATGLALFVLSGSINKRINTWISQSLLLDEDKAALQSKYCKTKHLVITVAWIIEIIIVVAQLLLYRYGILAIGNDAISIFAFGIAFFSENVETFFVRKFETELTEVKL